MELESKHLAIVIMIVVTIVSIGIVAHLKIESENLKVAAQSGLQQCKIGSTVLWQKECR